MTQVKANNIFLEVETFGDVSQPPVLLITALSCQLIHWHMDFCQKLADRGYYVIRFDNRDVGLSTKFHDAGIPNIQEILTSKMNGLNIDLVYDMDDMAQDALGVLDALKIKKAHVCGMSMGGMIAQTLAINHSDRIASLTSIYSTTGNSELPPSKPEAIKMVNKRPPAERNAFIEHMVEVYRVFSGNGLAYNREFNAKMAAQAYDRCYYPEGTGRQFAAILTQSDRRKQLSKLTIPSLVIHGNDDPLVPIECGYDTAVAIPNAKFIPIDGMGHELPVLSNRHWIEIFDHLVMHFNDVKHGIT
ncbi:MAG: alpha/beta hydrolase [Desulfobacteraceae bacterium]|jgi:pimeloyl-ACP methyl ester carboxylesterase